MRHRSALPSHSWLSRHTRGSPIAPTALPSYLPLRVRARVSPVALAWLFHCSHGPPIAPTALPSYPRLFYCSHDFPVVPRLFHHTLGSPIVPTALSSYPRLSYRCTALPSHPRLSHCTHGSEASIAMSLSAAAAHARCGRPWRPSRGRSRHCHRRALLCASAT